MPSSQNVVLKAKGLNTFKNYFDVSPGTLLEANNVNIDRDEIIEPRRGFAKYGNTFGNSTDRTKQLITYKNRILRHVLSVLQWDNGSGTFSDFGGDLTEVQPGLRVKSFEQNGNLYITTSEGIKKISASSAAEFKNLDLVSAGGIKALDLSANVNYTNPGFLPADSKVAYRLVWGYTDNNDNLILGVPSNRSVVQNYSASSATVNLTFPIPEGVDTSYFYQIYRTRTQSQSPTEIDPGDEMYLVLEDFPTSGQIIAGEITVNDITPEDIAINGALLYTNPNSGEGIDQANERPPFAQDIATYNGYAFYANTKTSQKLELDFLSVDNFISGTSTITITDGTTSEIYTFVGTNEVGELDFTGTFTDYHNTVSGTAKYITLDSSNDERSYLFWFSYDVNDIEPVVAGKINIKIDISTFSTVAEVITETANAMVDTLDFNVSSIDSNTIEIAWANNGFVTTPFTQSGFDVGILTYITTATGTGENASANEVFLPRVPAIGENGPTTAQQIEQVAHSLVRIVNQESTLINGFYLSGFDDIPGQIILENKSIVGNSFWVYADSTSTGQEFNPTLPETNTATVISSNEAIPNRVYYSKYQQPEAVPLLNYFDVGPKDKEIKRIVALRESLFIFKEDGIYRVSGTLAPFTALGFDFSAAIRAPDSAVVLNNLVYALTSQGIVTVTDGGVQVVSRPIENQLNTIMRPNYSFVTNTFGVSYESDRAYLLFTVTEPEDTEPTQCFRYNTFTDSWTTWDMSKTCGIVNFVDDKLYLGAGDANFIDQERKTLTRTDYADREYELNILLNGVKGNIIEVGLLSESSEGDSFVQTQYLNIAQYNRLLKQLDIDNQIKSYYSPLDPDYFSTLQFLPGENPRTKIVELATKLDSDPLGFNNYLSRIANYSQTIISTTHTTSQVTINFSSNNILPLRYVTISGSTTTPSIDGIHQVISQTGTSITINSIIDTDGGSGTVITDIQNFKDVQVCYNLIVENLNSDTGVFFTNYPLSIGTAEFEAHILFVNKVQTTITIDQDSLQLMAGPWTLYKAFETIVQYAPQFAQDPSITKHWREGTIMFENSNYTNATLSYSSDLSPFFEHTDFLGQGNGDWGQFIFGQQNWGGIGAPIPFRTLVPRQKQRCRFLNVKFGQTYGREKFSIYGISLTYRPVSTRGYLK